MPKKIDHFSRLLAEVLALTTLASVMGCPKGKPDSATKGPGPDEIDETDEPPPKEEPSALLFTLEGHFEKLLDASFSPDGTKIVTASFDKTAKVWDVSTGKLLFSIDGHASSVASASFSPDGTKIV